MNQQRLIRKNIVVESIEYHMERLKSLEKNEAISRE
jgi:hypothetical protein